jgi:hypothetical protein
MLNSVIAFYIYSVSISPGSGLVKVIGVGVAISVPWSSSGVYRISAICSSFDPGIPYKIGKPAARSRLQMKLR